MGNKGTYTYNERFELVIDGKVIKPGDMVLNTNGFVNRGEMCKFLGIEGNRLVKVQTYSVQPCVHQPGIEANIQAWIPYVVSGHLRLTGNKTERLAEYWDKYSISLNEYSDDIAYLTECLHLQGGMPSVNQSAAKISFEVKRHNAFKRHTERLFALTKEYPDVV